MSQKRSNSIEVVGAEANNLKNVSLTFPLRQISVVTGVSGSGKSSLLADTLAAEGSRRMQTFLGMSQELERDEVRAFIGVLPPTILVGQRGFRPSVRTTVGTASGLLIALRRLFILASTPYSERAKDFVSSPSPEFYAGWISKYYRGPAKIYAAPVRQQRTDGVSAVKRMVSHGIEQITIYSETDPARLRESGRVVEVNAFKGLNENVKHTIEALVGIVEVDDPSQEKELEELLHRAFEAGNSSVVVTLSSAGDNPDLSSPFGPRLDTRRHWVHPKAPDVFAGPSVHLLSFNAPEHEDSGACRSCGGTGIGRRLRDSVLIPHPNRSMNGGAFAIWNEKNYKYVNVQHETIEGLRGMDGFSPDVAWSKLPASARALLLNGSGGEPVFDREPGGRKFGKARPFPGFRNIILEKASAGTKIAEQLGGFVETGPCDSCEGTRWSFQARALRVGEYGIADILRMTFAEVAGFAEKKGDFATAATPRGQSLVETIRRHADSLVSVGLGYLTGDRGMLEVSEGESRRIRLARVLDAREEGLCLLLDEPARGLHESDLSGLASSLARLRGRHTLILNDHRERLWDMADWFVEVGPSAGAAGGEITYAGPRVQRDDATDQPLRTPLPVSRDHPKLTIHGASIHNLDNVDCSIPIGRMTCISGVSGSGKSSFIRGVLAPALLKSVDGDASDFAVQDGRWSSIDGTRPIKEVVALDQAMPPANRRSLVATFTGVFDGIRKVFGTSPAAKRDGLSGSDFGVNSGHGRCQVCAGVGEVPDGEFWSVCPSCGGSRYGHAALSVRIDGTNVQELLEMPVERLGPCAETFLIPQSLISAMCDLGIGYVALGRRVDCLSGGEVQRLRLAMRLGSVSSRSIFFILDEPAVGLHPRDVRRLATALERVLDGGRNTIVMVEHDLQLIRSADWVIDFGPGSGPDGGKIVFEGTPKRLAGFRTPTGLALSGKLTARNRSRQPAERGTARREKLRLSEQSERTTALMRTLIGGDTPPTLAADDVPAEPIVAISERFWSGRDSWEVAGLDLEIPKFLLDVQRTAIGNRSSELLQEWKKDRDCWLAVQPFLTDMQTWGINLPQSLIRDVSTHVSKEGLRLVTTKGAPVESDFDVRNVRATGNRLVPDGESEEACQRVLADAFAIGARYVELRDSKGHLRSTASSRLLDMETAVVAPMVPVPAHFSRLDAQGCCPMCKGSRGVTVIPDSLVIKDRKAPPDSERFLTPEANRVMKGVRQNELNPFLRRLAKEGLWEVGVSFERLEPDKSDIILFGFWSRPGPGSFLKSPSVNPSEVASWLRWDGLYNHVLDQADRSTNTEWARSVHEKTEVRRCALCAGSGLKQFANLLKVGDTSFAEWTGLSNPSSMLQLLSKMKTHTPRQQRTHKRIMDCLAPLAQKRDAATQVVERAVESFTTMKAFDSSDSAT